jgi:hypothetical protein
MILKTSKILLSSAVALSLINCSSDSTSGSLSTFGAVQQALETAAPDVNAAAIYLADPLRFSPRASVSAALTTDNSFHPPGGGSTTESLIQYVEKMYSDELDDSVFSRAHSPFLIACTIDALAAKTGDILNNGTQTLTIRASQLSACGTAADYTGAGGSLDGETVTAVISSTADTTYYDSYIIMDGATNPMFGGADQFIYFRKTATTLNFAHIEMDDSGSPTNVSATWLNFDLESESGNFQYLSRYPSGDQFYRISYDLGNNDARILTHSSGSGTVMTTIAASTATSQTQAAFSFSWAGQGLGDTVDANGCLDINGLTALDTDNTLTCTGNSKTVVASSVADAGAVAYATGLSIGTIAGYGSTPTTGDSLMPAFTGTDIATSTSGF